MPSASFSRRMRCASSANFTFHPAFLSKGIWFPALFSIGIRCLLRPLIGHDRHPSSPLPEARSVPGDPGGRRLLLEVLHGPVDVPARLLERARADQLILTRCAVDLLARPLHRTLVARGRADREEKAQGQAPSATGATASIPSPHPRARTTRGARSTRFPWPTSLRSVKASALHRIARWQRRSWPATPPPRPSSGVAASRF